MVRGEPVARVSLLSSLSPSYFPSVMTLPKRKDSVHNVCRNTRILDSRVYVCERVCMCVFLVTQKGQYAVALRDLKLDLCVFLCVYACVFACLYVISMSCFNRVLTM